MTRFLGLRGAQLTSAISAVCGLCFLCYGYAQGVMGGLLTVPAFLAQFPQVNTLGSTTSHTAWVTGLTVGAWNLGCIVSSILAIFLSDSLGRRRTLLLGITIWTIGEIIQASSYTVAQFVIGRAVAGFGNGFTTSTVPAYQAECVKSHRKGTILMVSTGAFVAFGYALSYWLVFGFAYSGNSSAAWRAPIALQILFALPVIVLMFFLPESPRWLILTGREKEALTVLAALNDADPESYEIKDEFLQIKDAILIMASGTPSKLFSNRERRSFHRVVLAYFIQVFAQGTGINLVLQYLSWIFLTRLGYAGWMASLMASCSATTYFIASFVAVVGIDRFWGRRSLMMFGASGMSGCMILITITQYLWTMQGINAGRIASTVFIFCFSIFFAIGWQGMAWLYQVEVVPLSIRGPANALSTKVNWIVNSIIVIITPIAFHNMGYRTWIIFACTNFAIIPLVYFFYPETAFRSLEEVDVIFYLADEMPGNPWLNVVKISINEPLWFGKRGEKRSRFNYEESDWHRRLMDLSGSGSDSNHEKRSKGKSSNGDSANNSGRRNIGSSGSDTVVPDTSMEHKRAQSESPIDPRMLTVSNPRDSSTQSVLTTTITSPRNSARSSRRVSKRPMSHDEKPPQMVEARSLHEQQRAFQPQPMQQQADMSRMSPESPVDGVGRFSPEADPSWWATDLAPAPLRISHPSSVTPHDFAQGDHEDEQHPFGRHYSDSSHHAYSTGPGTDHALHYPDYLDQDQDDDDDAAPVVPRVPLRWLNRRASSANRSVSSVKQAEQSPTGIKRTESGNETYYPDGIEPVEFEESAARSNRKSGTSSLSRKFTARDAGRAF